MLIHELRALSTARMHARVTVQNVAKHASRRKEIDFLKCRRKPGEILNRRVKASHVDENTETETTTAARSSKKDSILLYNRVSRFETARTLVL